MGMHLFRSTAMAWGLVAALLPATAIGQATIKAAAPDAASRLVGEVTYSRGAGFAQLPGSTPRTLGAGLPLYVGDKLTTSEGASAVLKLDDGTRMTLRPQTEVVLEQFQFKPEAPDNNMVMQLLRGGLRALTGLITKNNDKAARIKTPVATIGIRGTDFDARLCADDCAKTAAVAGEAPRPANLKASAKAVAVQGTITVEGFNGEKRKVVHGSSVYPGDLVETGPNASAVLAFRDESKVSLGAATRFKVDDFVFDRNNPTDGRFLVSLLKGTVRALTGLIGKSQVRNVSFRTPTATIGIRGTGLDMTCDDSGCGFFNWLGSITVTPEGHSALQVLQEGQGLFVSSTGIRPLTELPLPGVPRPDGVEVNEAPLFLMQDVNENQLGLYVLVRDGHVELFTDRGTLHLGRGELGLALDDLRVLRPLRVPLFMDLDPVPLPSSPNPLLTSVLGEAGLRPVNQCR
jgi:hypothetical protein